ncbi:MAG: hypothetical protein IT261_12225 [Saprospiraceae bacterium]|nr:hypothetical protein [Saprospiraceae bacterium]
MKYLSLFVTTTIILGITACWTNKDIFLGKVYAPITKDVFFSIYVSDKFEHLNSIYCKIEHNNDSSITKRVFIAGTDLVERNTNSFTSGELDSVIYLTYPRSKLIVAIYDLKKRRGYPFDDIDNESARSYADSLVSKLHFWDKEIKAAWQL